MLSGAKAGAELPLPARSSSAAGPGGFPARGKDAAASPALAKRRKTISKPPHAEHPCPFRPRRRTAPEQCQKRKTISLVWKC